ncbi:MAG: phosphoglucosamine mutase [Phycisphaeraceae bacterium]|nr:phosphoglucosamine mutase [Phycisphaeraceae bacterium]
MPDDAPLMLSVSGLRGLVDRTITPQVAARYGAAVGKWIRQSHPNVAKPLVVIGRDSRPSGESYQQAAAAGLMQTGCRAINLGITSTPGVAVMALHLQAQGGMVVTASHNPIVWNGMKAIRHDGSSPPAEDARCIIELFRADTSEYPTTTDIPTDATAAKVHCDAVLAQVDVELIRSAKLRCVLDSVHGAGGPEARLLLDALGVEVVHLYGEPTGDFPHSPEPTRENLTGLCDAMKQHDANLGFAQDPDADRLAVVDETGRYIGEEYTLALCTLHKLASGAVAVANLSTSRMIDDIAASVGATIQRTPVGEANVASAMRKHHALIGGEGNGGVILSPVSYIRDSLVAVTLLLELLARRRQPLSQIMGDIPAYCIVKEKIDADKDVIARLHDSMQNHFRGKLDFQDGVRVDWPDRWVHVRPSNTEPIIRLIAEARNESDARSMITECRKALKLE